MKKILLVNPPANAYSEAKVKFVAPEYPPLNLVTLGAVLREGGGDVRVLDLAITEEPKKALIDALKEYEPDVAGVTFYTSTFAAAADIVDDIKSFNKDTLVIAGGPHASANPEGVLNDSKIDVAIVGEGDKVINNIVFGKSLSGLHGVAYKKDGKVVVRPRDDFIEDLDELPYPAWDLIDPNKYHMPEGFRKREPVGLVETSRGCPYGCVYCNKSIFGRTFRIKSPERVVDEMQYTLDAGFRELHIADDGFTNNMERAEKICDLIVEKKMDFPWFLLNGIRVNRVSKPLLEKMKRAGCYRVAYGVESGDQKILDKIGKQITLEQIRDAFRMTREAGVESLGFFMLALPGDTEETMQKTIDFAIELDPDLAKFTVCTPLPGTPMFEKIKAEGRLLTDDWSDYVFHRMSKPIYRHENLEWDTVARYYAKAYRRFYFRPKLIMRRIRQGYFWHDLRGFFKTDWF